ncbi:hypothetical protein TKK_0003390 [Trichogramma kaykai]
MDLASIRDELSRRECNAIGPERMVQDRLLRARLRCDPQYVNLVPWFETDEASGTAASAMLPMPSEQTTRDAGKQVQFEDASSDDEVAVHTVVQAEVHAQNDLPSQPPTLAVTKPNHGRVASNAISPISAARVENNLMDPVRQPHLVIDKEVMKMLRTNDYQYIVAERVREQRTELPPTRLATDTRNKEMIKSVPSKFDSPQNFSPNRVKPSRSWYPSMPTEEELNRIEQAGSPVESQAEGDHNDEPTVWHTPHLEPPTENQPLADKRCRNDIDSLYNAEYENFRAGNNVSAGKPKVVPTPKPRSREYNTPRAPNDAAVSFAAKPTFTAGPNRVPLASSRNNHYNANRLLDYSSDEGETRCRARRPEVIKNWGPKVLGEDKQEDAEDFLDQLNKCVSGSGIDGADLLSALPCILTKRASRWFSTAARKITSWSHFEDLFRNQFIGEYDYWDLMFDLQKRTQAKGERISSYLSCFEYIVSRFFKPPPEDELLTIAYRNLLPEYRHAMADKIIESFEQLETKRKKEIDMRYAPPAPVERMRVPGGAYNPSARLKLAALESSDDSESSEGEAEVAALRARQQKYSRRDKPRSASSEKHVTNTRVNTVEQNLDVAKTATQANIQPSVPVLSAAEASQSPYPLPVCYDSCSHAAAINNPYRQYYGPVVAPNTPALPIPANIAAQDSSPFVSACFTCRAVGHRASACPEVVCHY